MSKFFIVGYLHCINYIFLYFSGDTINDCGFGPWFEAPIIRPWYYELAIIDISINNASLNHPCEFYNYNVSSVDSGTSFLGLPPKVFESVEQQLLSITQEKLPGEVPNGFWRGNGVVCWADDHPGWIVLPNITLDIAHSNKTTFAMTLGPRSYLNLKPDNSVHNENFAFKYSFREYNSGAESLPDSNIGHETINGNPSHDMITESTLMKPTNVPCYESGIGPSKYFGTILGN